MTDTLIGWKGLRGFSHSILDRPYLFGVGIMGHNPDNNPEGTDDIYYRTDTEQYIEDAANDHQFHTYKIKYDGFSNEVEVYKDGSLVTTLTAGARPYDELPLLISGRDYSNTNYLDYIYATAGPTLYEYYNLTITTTTGGTTNPSSGTHIP
ncbi:MAG: hypothetical protein AOA66_0840 [Candidatus Bathyarchaeota archaeon BA2]|nr:MAG: hypothetical protein AOA66_0840 [Candidatus Bathyarchaeota archaeon BA2]